MNKWIAMGRLTRDPEVKVSQGDLKVGKFSIAVDRRIKRDGEPDADFFNCTAFGKQAEFVEKYLRKGIKVIITGRIQNDNYTNKEGQQVYGVSVIIEDIEFAESKKNDGSAPQQYQQQAPQQYQQPPQYGYQQQAPQQYQQPPQQYQQPPQQYQQQAPAPTPQQAPPQQQVPQQQPQMAPEGFAPVNGGDPFGLGMGNENYV